MKRIFQRKRENQKKNKVKVIGFDARADFTLFNKNQIKREEHLTVVDQSGNYMNHHVLPNKLAVTVSDAVIHDILDFDSQDTLEILYCDGEPVNSGYKGWYFRIIACIMGP